MVEAAETDKEIAKRVELYKHRIPEEFYNLRDDPNALKNLIDNPEYAGEIEKFREKMLQLMKKYKDPAYEAFRDRMIPGTIDKFMTGQKAEAEKTGRDINF